MEARDIILSLSIEDMNNTIRQLQEELQVWKTARAVRKILERPAGPRQATVAVRQALAGLIPNKPARDAVASPVAPQLEPKPAVAASVNGHSSGNPYHLQLENGRARPGERRAQLLEILRKEDRPMLVGEIAKLANCDYNIVLNTLITMQHARLVSKNDANGEWYSPKEVIRD